MMEDDQRYDLIVLIPVFNDWDSLYILLDRIDQEIRSLQQTVRIILVNDGSIEPLPLKIEEMSFDVIACLDVLALKRNFGHQRAIALGLSYVEENCSCRYVLVMDGDGEDAPSDIPRLLEKLIEQGERKIIFAERSKRSESTIFKFFYRFYRIIHWLLTGIRVRVGNFSIIPCSILPRLVIVSDLWNHYAASVFKARFPFEVIQTDRANRLAGQSRMNFVSLVIHGISAISVFGDLVGVRLLIFVAIITCVVLSLFLLIFLVRFFTQLAVPGWATYTSGILLIILVQMGLLSLLVSFVILAGRDSSTTLPKRDYVFYVDGFRNLFKSHE